MNALKQEALAEFQAREAAIDSLLAFTEYTFDAWETGAHHSIIAEALESVERGDTKRLIITAPHESGSRTSGSAERTTPGP